ncbi:MAG TPA: DUF433 domain-containing protein [Candidatus Acetothermia bacterium]|nr:DUF433 domain-containing protein [Candidatus Acetothermia bacterium]
MKEITPGIIVDDRICFGKPVIKGTRVPVEIVLGKLAGGARIDEVMREYDLSREQVLAALRYAAAVIAEEEVHAAG